MANLKELSSDELKHIQLEMLIDFAQYCDNNDINYYLSSGTLLGAIRHKGFIPWDDDIDIMLPRPDYEKAVTGYNHPIYKVDDILVNPDSIVRCGRIYNMNTIMESNLKEKYKTHVFIDLFPIDGVEEDPDAIHKKMRKLKIYIGCHLASITAFKPSHHYDDKDSGLFNLKSRTRTLIKYVMITLFGNTKPQYWMKKINDLVKSVKFGETSLVGCLANGYYGAKEIMNYSIYRDKISVDFENHKFWAPIGYDEYLRNLYDDYMQLPPVDKRVSHHEFKAYKIEK